MQELDKLKMSSRWKVEDCYSGKECWCATIVTEDIIDEDNVIIPAAAISRDMAKYIVTLHNSNLLDKRVYTFGK